MTVGAGNKVSVQNMSTFTYRNWGVGAGGVGGAVRNGGIRNLSPASREEIYSRHWCAQSNRVPVK
jgi:hypothetical protein